MEENEKENGAKKISRRDFLKSASLFAGGAAAGAAAGVGVTYGLVPKEAAEVVEGVPGPETIREVIKYEAKEGVL
jgi:hypothetical protein